MVTTQSMATATPEIVAKLPEDLSSSSNHKMAEDEDLGSHETDSDDDDGDDDNDENLDNGSIQGAVVVSKATGTVIQKKEIAKVQAKPKAVKKRKKRKMKPKDYPKRPLSAYNLFFKQTREKNLEEQGKLNFQEMVKTVAAQWKEITPEAKTKYQDLAAEDLARYKKAVGVYEREMLEKNRLEREEASKARKKFLAEEEQQAKQAKNEAAMRGTAFPPSLASASATAGGGWEGRGFASGNPHLAQAAQIPNGDYPFSLERTLMNPNFHRDRFPGNGYGSADLNDAQSRIYEELRTMEEARAIQLRLELAQGNGAAAAAALQRGGRAGMMGSLDSTGPAELNLQHQQHSRYLSAAGLAPRGGGDTLAAANDAGLRGRLALIRNPDFAAEHEARLLNEARLAALGHSGFSAGTASLSPYSSLFAPMSTSNPYEEIMMREQILRQRQELLLRAGMGSLYDNPGSALHSALGGGVGPGHGGLGGAQSFADLGYSGAAEGGMSSLAAGYDPQARLGMGLAPNERFSALGRLSDEELLRSLSRQANGRSLSYQPAAGGTNNKGIDSTE